MFGLPPNDEASVDGGEQDELIPEFSDARPGQGEVVHIVESVVPSLLTSPLPSELNETLVVEQDEGEQGLVRLGVPSIVVAVEPQLRRAYLAIGFRGKVVVDYRQRGRWYHFSKRRSRLRF